MKTVYMDMIWYDIYIYNIYTHTVHIKVELTWSMVTLQVALLARWLSNKGIQVMPSTWSALGKLGSSWTPMRAKIKHLDCRAFDWECRHFMSVWLELHYAGVLCRFLWSPNLLFAKWPGFLGGMHRWIRLIYQKDSKTCSKTCDSRGCSRSVLFLSRVNSPQWRHPPESCHRRALTRDNLGSPAHFPSRWKVGGSVVLWLAGSIANLNLLKTQSSEQILARKDMIRQESSANSKTSKNFWNKPEPGSAWAVHPLPTLR